MFASPHKEMTGLKRGAAEIAEGPWAKATLRSRRLFVLPALHPTTNVSCFNTRQLAPDVVASMLQPSERLSIAAVGSSKTCMGRGDKWPPRVESHERTNRSTRWLASSQSCGDINKPPLKCLDARSSRSVLATQFEANRHAKGNHFVDVPYCCSYE